MKISDPLNEKYLIIIFVNSSSGLPKYCLHPSSPSSPATSFPFSLLPPSPASKPFTLLAPFSLSTAPARRDSSLEISPPDVPFELEDFLVLLFPPFVRDWREESCESLRKESLEASSSDSSRFSLESS